MESDGLMAEMFERSFDIFERSLDGSGVGMDAKTNTCCSGKKAINGGL